MSNTIGRERTERIERILELVYLQTKWFHLKRKIGVDDKIEYAAGQTVQAIIDAAKELQEIVDSIKSETKVN